MLIQAQVRRDPPAIILFFLLYSLLIHFGMLFWLLSGIVSIVRNDFRIERSRIKVACALLGVLAGVPILWEFFSNLEQELGVFLLISNLPAVLLTGAFVSEADSLGFLSIIIFFPLFNFIGGWGIGQFLEWSIRRIKR